MENNLFLAACERKLGILKFVWKWEDLAQNTDLMILQKKG